MITTIIFDIGNVLAAYDWEGALRRLGCQDETFEAVADAVFRSPDWKEMDRGVLTLEELLQRFIRRAPEYEKRSARSSLIILIWPVNIPIPDPG
ncbi:MAG: hypothetical protein ACLR6B_16915 [Blautia sp.]